MKYKVGDKIIFNKGIYSSTLVPGLIYNVIGARKVLYGYDIFHPTLVLKSGWLTTFVEENSELYRPVIKNIEII